MACSISLKHTFLTTICLCYDNYGLDISEGQVKYLHVYQGVKIYNSLHVYKTIDICSSLLILCIRLFRFSGVICLIYYLRLIDIAVYTKADRGGHLAVFISLNFLPKVCAKSRLSWMHFSLV